MNAKQILLIGGGTAFGAVAAVVLMKALPAGSSDNTGHAAGGKPQTELAAAGEGRGAKSENATATANVGPILEELAANAPEIDAEELERRRDEFRDGMKERQMERLTDKMAKWSAALGLDKGQQEKLLEGAGAQFDELETLAAAAEGGDPAAMSESAKRAMAIMSGRALEESMLETLTPDQKAKYEEFGTQQNASRAEARTLR